MKIVRRVQRGFDLKRNVMILKGLFGLLRLNRTDVSGLELCLLSLGSCFRISKWSTGIPSRLRKDLIPAGRLCELEQ